MPVFAQSFALLTASRSVMIGRDRRVSGRKLMVSMTERSIKIDAMMAAMQTGAPTPVSTPTTATTGTGNTKSSTRAPMTTGLIRY